MKGRIKDLGFGLQGDLTVTLTLPREHAQELQELMESEVRVEIKKWRNRRSNDANALLWAICNDIAKALPTPHTDREIYRRAVLEVGPYTPVPIKSEAVEALKDRWSKQGIAWIVEVEDDSKLQGYKRVRLYYGSSTYDTKEMSRLLDYLVDEAQQMGLTLRASKAEIEEAKRRWGDA
jgi:hypothetical protein